MPFLSQTVSELSRPRAWLSQSVSGLSQRSSTGAALRTIPSHSVLLGPYSHPKRRRTGLAATRLQDRFAQAAPAQEPTKKSAGFGLPCRCPTARFRVNSSEEGAPRRGKRSRRAPRRCRPDERVQGLRGPPGHRATCCPNAPFPVSVVRRASVSPLCLPGYPLVSSLWEAPAGNRARTSAPAPGCDASWVIARACVG